MNLLVKLSAAMIESKGVKMMSERIKVADLPVFDAALYLQDDETVAAFLADIAEADDEGLMASALSDVARANALRRSRMRDGSPIQTADSSASLRIDNQEGEGLIEASDSR